MSPALSPATPTAAPTDEASRLEERLAGTLLGTALGDALGLPAEGLPAGVVRRRFGRLDRFRLLGETGFVSDDTEQAALAAECLACHPDDPAACAAAFRRELVSWFMRLPWGVGLATVRACLRSAAGLRPSGVFSAGNGALMRAAGVGVFFAEQPGARRTFGRALAEVTHRDPRAVEAALFSAELAAGAALREAGAPEETFYHQARPVVQNEELAVALERAASLAREGREVEEAAGALGTTGYAVHTASFALFCFLRHGDQPAEALVRAVSAGGDSDSIGAVLGGWLGALHGEGAFPQALLGRIHDGPFGPSHLRALARCLARVRSGQPVELPRYSRSAALLRNLALYPVVLAHGFRRLLP